MLYPNAPHFYHDDNWAPDVTFCGDNALARLRAGRQYEGDVSCTLAFFAGTFGDAMIKILLDFARVRARSADVELWVGSEWLFASGSRRPGDHRSPDIIITRRNDHLNVVLVIELKGRAWVNGHDNYCPIHCHTLGYANQIIC